LLASLELYRHIGEKIPWQISSKYNKIPIRKERFMAGKIRESGTAGCIYVLGLIGAAVYFIGQATGFWMGVLGFLKALVWPAFVVYGLLKFLGV